MKYVYVWLRLILICGEKFDKIKKCNIQNIIFKLNNVNFYLICSFDIVFIVGVIGGSVVVVGYVYNFNVNIVIGKSVIYEYMFFL